VRRLWIPAALVFAMLALAAPAMAVQFTDGVASGDVTSTRAVLWTRADTAENYKVEGWTNSSLSGPKAFKGKMKTTAARDYTIKIDVAGLQPNTQYWYQFQKDEVVSDVGTFKTAPDPNSPANVKFTYTGDSDVTKVNGVPAVNDFQTLNAAQQENADFWVYLGDTIYSDSSFRPGGPATTLDQYRATYREGRTYPKLTNLLKSTSTYATWDDHEVVNDYSGTTVDPARFAAARQAFMEYMPIRETGLLHDPSCAGDPLYRTYQWGSDVEVFMLDERSCRTQEATVACLGDLGPTLPTSVRTQFPFNQFLTPNPPAGCQAAIDDPARTMLGPVQKAKFLNDLQSSTAQYKLVVNQDPIQQFFVLPYDRWEGFGADRNAVLDTIRNNGISNVLFLTTDTHATLQNQVFKNRFGGAAGNQRIADEMVTGPIATTTFQNEVLNIAGPSGLFAVNLTMNLAGIDCRNLNQNSYALVDTTAGGTTTITSKTDAGVPVQSQQNFNIFCTGTYGP
jgi:alkaline phosphatase D